MSFRPPVGALLGALLFLVPGAATALEVFTCEPEWAALARALGGEHIDVRSAIGPRQDPHYLTARPSFIARARRAELLVCSGAGLEAGWLPLLLRQAGNGRIQPGQPGHFMAAEQVQRLEIPTHLDRREGHIHAQGNPHVHLDPRRLRRIADALGARMAELDPGQATHYAARTRAFTERLETTRERLERDAEHLRGLPVVVHHQHWVYLRDWLGLERVGTLEPRPGVPPTASHLAALLERLQAQPARMTLRNPLDPPRPAEWLAARGGPPVVDLPMTVAADDDLVGLYEILVERLLQAAGPPDPPGPPGPQ